MIKLLNISAVLCICFCSWTFKEQKQIHFTFNGRAQGTTYLISYYDTSQKVSQQQVDSILHIIDDSMSLYKPNSLISKINNSPKGGKLDPHFLKVMKRSIEINKETNGVFDITVAPLVAAWGFSSEKIQDLPDSTEISKILPFVGMKNIKLKGKNLKKLNPNVKIDLNGIAQGYTVDVLADFLLERGVNNFLVEIGGELRVEGKKPKGEDFAVGIEGPISSDQVAIKHVALIRGKALTTSGSYRNYKEHGEEKTTHIIDPKTGYPTRSEILSVTVLAKDAMSADGYDNALLAMGIKDATDFVNHHPNLEAYFIYKDKNGNIQDWISDGFRNILRN